MYDGFFWILKRNYCIEILKTELTISHRTEAQCRRTTGRSAQANPSAPGAHHDKTWTRPGFSPIDKMKKQGDGKAAHEKWMNSINSKSISDRLL